MKFVLVLLALFALVASAPAPSGEPLVGGFRPVPPSVGGPVGVANVDDSSRSVLEGGTQVKPWLKDQPKLGGQQ